ncbi:MAG TPA: carboxypeptidase-like regulatory domain-containing protein [Planctomycetota bacterium]|nr:carboxypeptidase-like regulatory domain-containing protein [Planctomycetota bacterium]
MKPARIWLALTAVVLVGGAGISYWLLQDRTARSSVEAQLSKPDAPIISPVSAKEALEAARSDAAETDSQAVAADTRHLEADASLLEILIADPSNAPVADARLAIFREDTVLAEFATSSDGLARFRDLTGSAEYAIVAPGWEYARGTLELGAGRRTLALPEGATVAGTVTVNGAPPAEAFDVYWYTITAEDAPILPLAVVDSVRGKLLPHGLAAARTKPDGTFSIRGVPPQASGLLGWESRYLMKDAEAEDSGRQLMLESPRHDLVLDMTEGCEMRLRVIDAAGAPVPRASVTLRRTAKSHTRSDVVGIEHGIADAEGRYSKVFLADGGETFALSVAGANSSAAMTYELLRPALRGVWDAGELMILPTRTVGVLVQDAAGKPVSGAKVHSWPGLADAESPRTNDVGRIDVGFSPENPTIAVEAFGFLSMTVDVAPDANEVTATLERATTLEFELEESAGETEGLTLSLRGPTPMFVDDDRELSKGQGLTRPRTLTVECDNSSSLGLKDGTTVSLSPSWDGRWRVSGLLANQPLRACLQGVGRSLCEVEIAPLSRGEQRKVMLKSDQQSKSLIVRVLGPSGKPCSSAWIHAREGLNDFDTLWLDSKGELKLTSLYGERCVFIVESERYAPRRICLQPIPDGRYDVVLEPAQSLDVELVDAAGAPFVGAAEFQANLGTPTQLRRSTLAPGRYRLDGLPHGDVLIEVDGEFSTVKCMRRAGEPTMQIVVGEAGQIPVLVTGNTTIDAELWMVAAAPAGAKQEVTRAVIRVLENGSGYASIQGLGSGDYEIWLVRRTDPTSDDWVPAGAREKVEVDARAWHNIVKMQLPR